MFEVKKHENFVCSAGDTSSWLGIYSRYFIHIDHIHATPREDDRSFRVLNHFSEPLSAMSPIDQVIALCDEYDLILTYSDEVVMKAPNAVYFPYGTLWVPLDFDICPTNSISFIFSEGGHTTYSFEGYDLRASVLYRLKSEKPGIVDIFKGTNRTIRPANSEILDKLLADGHNVIPLGPEKSVAFKHGFQIVIENEITNGWFTEKLLDCFAQGVVPIYLGCPNISEFFDDKGIIHCTNIDDIIESIHNIYNGNYSRNEDAMRMNFELCREYADVRLRAKIVISSEIRSKIINSKKNNT